MSGRFDRLLFSALRERFGVTIGENEGLSLADHFHALTDSALLRVAADLIDLAGPPTYVELFDKLQRQQQRSFILGTFAHRAQRWPITVTLLSDPRGKDWYAYFDKSGKRYAMRRMENGEPVSVPDCEVDEFAPGWRNSQPAAAPQPFPVRADEPESTIVSLAVA
jgi:hypothetical protein